MFDEILGMFCNLFCISDCVGVRLVCEFSVNWWNVEVGWGFLMGECKC